MLINHSFHSELSCNGLKLAKLFLRKARLNWLVITDKFQPFLYWANFSTLHGNLACFVSRNELVIIKNSIWISKWKINRWCSFAENWKYISIHLSLKNTSHQCYDWYQQGIWYCQPLCFVGEDGNVWSQGHCLWSIQIIPIRSKTICSIGFD